jgi:streptomycin 3"-adenylyltransferase
VEQLIRLLVVILDDRLTGVYLHGSLAMASYYRPKSDIDVIVVANDELEANLAERLGISIANLAESRPTTGNLELSVIAAHTAQFVPEPTPYELHYSTMWHDKLLRREVNYGEVRTDGDLASHLMYVVQRGICLYGKPINDVFGNVAWSRFMESVLDDLSWIVDEDHILESPFYGVLNICRVLQLISEDDSRVHSKDEGGEWGLKNLPHLFHPIIRQSLDVYRSDELITEEHRKTGGRIWEQEPLLLLKNYASSKLKEYEGSGGNRLIIDIYQFLSRAGPLNVVIFW